MRGGVLTSLQRFESWRRVMCRARGPRSGARRCGHHSAYANGADARLTATTSSKQNPRSGRASSRAGWHGISRGTIRPARPSSLTSLIDVNEELRQPEAIRRDRSRRMPQISCESMSRTATSAPVRSKTGTTISERADSSQAMWPGKAWTSATSLDGAGARRCAADAAVERDLEATERPLIRPHAQEPRRHDAIETGPARGRQRAMDQTSRRRHRRDRIVHPVEHRRELHRQPTVGLDPLHDVRDHDLHGAAS